MTDCSSAYSPARNQYQISMQGREEIEGGERPRVRVLPEREEGNREGKGSFRGR